MAQHQDASTVFGDAYSRTAPRVLRELHTTLLDLLEHHLSQHPGSTLAILGPGGYVLPYAFQYNGDGTLGKSNRDRIKNMLPGARIILVDYVVEEDKNGLERARKTLASMGFFEPGYFSEGALLKGTDSNRSLVSLMEENTSSISFVQNNLRDTLGIPNSSMTVIDVTLTMHHATVTRKELERLCHEYFRILAPGGMLHIGEGSVDMNYSEDKIIRIGQDIASVLETSVRVEDARDKGNGYVMHTLFEPGKQYTDLSEAEEKARQDHFPLVRITEEGLVTVKGRPGSVILRESKPAELAERLSRRGYKQLLLFHDSVTFPLIDPEMEEDRQGLIEPVERYYAAIAQRLVESYGERDRVLVDQVLSGIAFEKGNAKRGTVEYYLGREKIEYALRRVGFVDIQVRQHNQVPFYNLTARKPEG
ncbi:hypothetical protein HYS48_01115 [Candidatus Woesearchaeota archaeon]|nr:hypothetical protein [Candidatus Woesearchaeota archaeon]